MEAPIGSVAELSLGSLVRFQMYQFYTNGQLDTNTCTEAELKFVKKNRRPTTAVGAKDERT